MDKSDVEMEDVETLNNDSGYNLQESDDGGVENKDDNFAPSIPVSEDANKCLNSVDEPCNLEIESRDKDTVTSDMEGQINCKGEVIEPRNHGEPIGVFINAQTSTENEESTSTKNKVVKQTADGSAMEEQTHVSNEVLVCNTTNGKLDEEKPTEGGLDSGNPVIVAVKEIKCEDVEKKHKESATPVEHVKLEKQTTAIADTGSNSILVGRSLNKLSASGVPLCETIAGNKLLTDGVEEMKDLLKSSLDREAEDEHKEQSKEKEVIAAEMVVVDGGDYASFSNQEEPVTPKLLVKSLPATPGNHHGETVKPVSTLATGSATSAWCPHGAHMGESDDGTPEEQAIFMKDVESFYRERSMDFKPPKFYGQPLNCLKLWRAVIRLGGYDRVTGAKLWRQVGESFHPPKTCTTVSWTFRIFYEKSLLEYERHKKQIGELHFPVVPLPEASGIDIEGNGYQGTGSGRVRRDSATRAMQVWHGQDIFSHGEAGEPVAKDKNLNNMTKREKSLKSIGSVKQRRPNEVELSVKAARTETSKQLVTSVVDIGPPADWVKINVRQTKDCFEVYALVPGLLREEVRVQSDPAGRLVITGQPEQVDNPWGITPFKKIVSLPARIDPLQTSAVVSLHGRLFVRVPFEQSNI
ncbi:AT-rich interactive domain-containing protein 5-like [Dorcoceras hygrometricum]|uniref:AT-rich interactive domain-containing protein 5-like n=1 Tax=Dorcoceras hygrometricum TaxID=472368 RepID=A0A2Z7CF10_9LAMI|nr:AT-rich interactive domain-containing protein 5-like [Dorcoceras hygrometricum]